MISLCGKIVVAPIEVFSDHRLGRIELRVLLALYSFRGKNDDCVYPHRDTIAKRCGYSKNTVSKAVTALESYGWIKRKQHRGPNTYFLELPETMARPETVTDSDTVSESATVAELALNSGRSGKKTVAESVTPKHTSNIPIELNPKKLNVLPCPHSRIISVYHETLPELPCVIESRWKGSQRARDLQTRWKEDERHRDLEFWRWLFKSMRANRFWLGDNDRGWRADLGWIVKRTNFDKVLDHAVNQRQAVAR